jgi:transposase
MSYSRKQFLAKGFEEADWQKCFHRNQQAYIRLKLACVKSYAEGNTPEQIAGELSLSRLSVRRCIAQYLRGGLVGLCQPTRRPQPSLLTASQAMAFKEVLLSSPPQDHGLEGRITDHVTRSEIDERPALLRHNATLQRFTAAVRQVAPDATGTTVGIQESSRTIVKAFLSLEEIERKKQQAEHTMEEQMRSLVNAVGRT